MGAEAAAVAVQEQPSASVAVALNPQSGDPGKQLSIREAYAATVAKLGPITYEDEASLAAAHVERDDTAPEPVAEPEKPKAKKVAKEPENEPATDDEPDEEEEPEKPTAKEAVTARDLIKERQKLRERFERNEQAQANRWGAKAREIQATEQKLEPLMRAARALESGDFDGIAKALGEHLGNPEVVDWNTFNSEALKATQSPVYKKMRDLERRQAEDAKAREQQQEANRRAYSEQQQAQELANWKRNIAAELSADDDPAIPAMIESRPELVDSLHAIQRAHYHETRGDILSPRDAAVKLLKNVRNDFKFWSDFFVEHEDSDAIKALTGSQSAPKKKTAVTEGRQRTETSEKRGAATRPAPKNVSQTQTAQASAIGQMSDAEKIKLAAMKMQQDFERIR
jgi:hypothetical protein